MSDSGLDAFALPTAYRLDGYEIMRVLGYGGFGITYLAQELETTDRLAIKEYFPTDLAVRLEGGVVAAQSEEEREVFDWGLNKFVKEAQTLARFSHPNIVRVRRFLNLNSTAYMVMDYEQGEPLGKLLDEGGDLSEEEIREFLPSMLDGLDAVHKAGVLHRDIKPDNIIIRQDGQPVLIDFGAARMEVGQQSRSLHRVFTPGYAAPEQYITGEEQGPWTDIYGMAAVLYSAISGRAPTEAPARTGAMMRSSADVLEPAVQVGDGRFHPEFLAAIDWGLQIEPEDRPRSVAAWKAALEAPWNAPDCVPASRSASPQIGAEEEEADIPTLVAGRSETVREAEAGKGGRRLWPILAGLGVVVVVGVGLGWYLINAQQQADASDQSRRAAGGDDRAAGTGRPAPGSGERRDARRSETRRTDPDAIARRKIWRVGAEPEFESRSLRDALTRAPDGSLIVVYKQAVLGGVSVSRNITVAGTSREGRRTRIICYDEPCVAFNGNGAIRNLDIMRRRRGFDGPAIRVNDGQVRIANVNISSHGGVGIDIAGGTVLLVRSWIFDSGRHGIIIRPSALDVRMRHNKVFLNLRTGIVINARTMTVLRHNTVERNRQHGIMILGASKADMVGNTVHQNRGAGIHLAPGATHMDDKEIRAKNKIKENQSGGIVRRK